MLGAYGLLPFAAGARAPAGKHAVLYNGKWPVRPLLQADLRQLLDTKNRKKIVHDRHVIDDMESEGGWIASDAITLGYTRDRARSGTRSLRFSTLLRNENYIRASRRPNGSFTASGVPFEGQPFAAFARKRFTTPQDWRAFNRLSLWCYVHPTTNPINTISVQFTCDGAPAGPLDPVAVNYFGDLRSGAWNHLVWEIPEQHRDRVVEILIFQTLSGVSVAGADPRITYDFDELCVERVDAEPVAGWHVTPGKIAYCHLGYQPGSAKVAIAPDGPATFDLLDASTDRVVARLKAETLRNGRGAYRLLDFSSFSQSGHFRLRHGATTSEPFPVSVDSWQPAAEAVLNTFYGMRCGFPLPGVHDACHQDLFVEYRGERRIVGGGWHDAANLTQGPYRTHLSIYALCELHDAMVRNGKGALAERALEEALWGIDWSLRMRFGPGLRTLYHTASYWTDSRAGTIDDAVQAGDAGGGERGGVGRDDFQNILSVLAGARAARLLKKRDPVLAAKLLAAAREDFALVSADIQPWKDAPPRQINDPSWRDQIGYATLAAVELYRATGDSAYEVDAVRLAVWLADVQERRFVDGIPIAGYFYEDAGRTRLVHEYHNSFEDGGLLAFAALCETFPKHRDWMEWYAGLAIYAEHFCATGSRASVPFGIIPSAVWRRSDLDAPTPVDRAGAGMVRQASAVFPTPPSPALIRRQMQAQYDAGTPLGPNHVLRVMPLWYDHVRKGATTVHMSKTIGLGAAAAVLGRAELSELGARQLEWVYGANPFSRSIVYGVGNDFWQNFTVALPNFVGGMSLGFNSYEEDAPAWGNNAVFPYKEMWIYSACRMALNLSRVGTGATVTGSAPAGARFHNIRSQAVTEVRPGRFRQQIPAGEYEVRSGKFARRLSLADGASMELDLDERRAFAATADVVRVSPTQATIAVSVTGSGRHELEVRAWNASIAPFDSVLDLGKGQATKSLSVVVKDPNKPWIVLLEPAGSPADRIEVGRDPQFPKVPSEEKRTL